MRAVWRARTRTIPSVVSTVETTRSRVVDGARNTTVYLDFDTVMLARFQGRRGIELSLQADIPEAIDRLSEIADQIVVLIDPAPGDEGHGLETSHRLEVMRGGLGTAVDRVSVVTCPHTDRGCDCAKPGSGLVKQARRDNGLSRGGWYIGGDQEGVVAGRNAGLRTIRVGPVGEDHLSVVHKPDYEARDLLDAANRIMLEELAG